MKNKIIGFVIAKSRVLAIASTLVLIFFLAFSKAPGVDGHLTGFNVEHSAYYKNGVAIANHFGSTKFIQINVVPENTTPGKVFEGLKKLEDNLVKELPDIRVQSLHQSSRLLKFADVKSDNIHELLHEAARLPLVDQLISKSEKSFLMIAFAGQDQEVQPDKLDAVLHQKYEGIKTLNVFSPYHVEHEIAKSIRRDIVVLTLAISLFFTLLVFYAFRTISALVYSIVIIVSTVLPVFFLFTLMDIPLNIITVLVIPVLTILSLSDALHLLTGYTSTEGANHNEKMSKVLSNYFVPSFLTSLTISIAFLSFQFNDSENIRNFGLITGISVMIGFFMTIGFGIYLLQFVKSKRIENHRFSFITKHILKRRVFYGIIMLGIFIASLWFLPLMKFNTNMDIFIPRGTQLKKDHELLTREYYSQLRIEVMIKVKGQQRTKKELQQTVVGLHESLEAMNGIGKVSSIKDQIDFKAKYGVLGGFIRFPSKQNPYVTQDKSAYRLDIRLVSANNLKNVAHYIENYFKADNEHYEVKIFSNGLLVDEVNASVAQSLLDSMLFSEIFIALLILLMTRSVVHTLSFVFVNTIPLTAISIFIYAFGWDLNILTAITTVVCIGIIVDDSIHIMYRRIVLKSDLQEVSFGILTTTLILITGFMMFLLSSFVPSQIFGLLSAIIFFIGVLSDMTLLPYLVDKYEELKPRLPFPFNKTYVRHKQEK